MAAEADATAPAVLTCPGVESTTGAYKLSWTAGDAEAFRLEEDGTLVYAGVDNATTLTGRESGSYSYRVGVVDGAGRLTGWSDPCVVIVDPPTPGTTAALFLIGLIIFMATLVLIVRGDRAHRRSTE